MSAAGIIAVTVIYLCLFRFEQVTRFRRGGFHHRVTQFGYVVLIILLLSGFALYLGSALPLQDIHYYSALALALYFILHAIVVFVLYGWGIFTRLVQSARLQLIDGILIVAASLIFVGLAALIERSTHNTLNIQKMPITQIIEIDGYANEAIWQTAKPITIHTHGGANFINGSTPVTLRALHNGAEAYFHITWQDPTQSLQHLPLRKTETGWQVVEDGFYQFDEQSFYEDKFALMLSDNCESGGSKTTSLGPKPLADKPANWHGKGYHYSSDDKIRDIWHWKAVRTNDMYLADDNFFGPPDIARDGQRRYSAGYLADGKESGAYVMNWQWYSPKGVQPKRLPKDPALLAAYQDENGLKNAVAPWYDFELYDAKQDHYPTGTLAPSVLHLSNRFEGDRADVRARGQWQDGIWSLELVRPLDTQSAFDVAMQSGICLWVSAFDHSQIAHTRHVRPARLALED